VAVFPVPPSFEVTALVVLVNRPVAAPVALTITVKVHVLAGPPPPKIVAPDRLTVPDPAVAVMVPPPQFPDNPLGVATSNPAGSMSVNPMPVKVGAGKPPPGEVFGL
jgi:hypothetical protein